MIIFFQHIYYPTYLDEIEQRLINLGVSPNMLQSLDGYIYISIQKFGGSLLLLLFLWRWYPQLFCSNPDLDLKISILIILCVLTYLTSIKKEPEKKKCIWLLWPHMVELWSDSQSNNSDRSCNLKHFVLWLYKYKISFEKKNSKQSCQFV